MLNIVERVRTGRLDAEVVLVVGSRECLGLERARALGLPTILIPGEIPAGELDGLVRDAHAGLVVLAGYIRLVRLTPWLEGRVVNIHPALLPSFGGPGMYGDRVHQAVIDAGCKLSGCTVHLCDAEYDRGPIIVQRSCPVLEGDTPAALATRVFEQECQAYPEALELLMSGRVQVEAASGPGAGRRARILPC